MSMSVVNTSQTRDAELADLIDRLTARLKAGEVPDLDDLLREHSEYADELRQLFPAVRMMADLSRSGDSPRVGDDLSALGELGDYLLVREVGRGGMGVVYEAEQRSLRRRVALKVLPWAAAMDPKQLQRFKNEALAAASLKHEHIVSVYAVGCERGVHFYAMEFVDGQTLAEALAEIRKETEEEVHHRDTEDTEKRENTVPKSSLCSLCLCGKKSSYFRHIAELIAQAADALEHAHSMGIVHRDVKPGNLLLDNAGKVYVSDFGLARFGPDAGMTMTGDLIGTLRYMSPEQALAKHGLVDHRTDVYSLGATLYELLTLRPAVDGADKQEILKRIAFEEPAPLRKHDKAIPAELETITLKCLAKEPGERYPAAGELAEDLRRWLGDQSIRAKPPSPPQRMLKWSRRHRAAVAAVAFVFLIGLGLGGGTWIWWHQKTAAVDREAELALDEAIRLQDKALRRNALSAVRRAESLLAGGSVNEALRRNVVDRRADLEMAVSLDDIVDRLQTYDPFQLATAYERVFRQFGLDVEAMDAGEAAERIQARSISLRLAAALDIWAQALGHSGLSKEKKNALSKEEALRRQKHVLAVARAVDSDPYRNRLRDALQSWDPAALNSMAISDESSRLDPASLYLLGAAIRVVGTKQDALAFFQRAQKQYPGDFKICEDLAWRYLSTDPPRYAEAVHYFGIAVALSPLSPAARINLSVALQKSGDLDGAIEYARDAVRLDPAYTFAAMNLGSFLRMKGDFDGAIKAFRLNVQHYPNQVQAHHLLASALEKNKEYEESEQVYRQVLRMSPTFGYAYVRLGQVLLNQRKFAEAREAFRTGLEKVVDKKDIAALEEQIPNLDRIVDVEKRLPAILRGEQKLKSNAAYVSVANLCLIWKLNAAAAQLYRQAVEQDPAAAADLKTSLRYNAACTAALAGCGQGNDADTLDDAARSRLRQQALDWLTADLAAWTKLAESAAERPKLRQTLQRWQEDTDFAGVRGDAALAKLSEAERVAWQKLWADVAELLKRSTDSATATQPKGKPSP